MWSMYIKSIPSNIMEQFYHRILLLAPIIIKTFTYGRNGCMRDLAKVGSLDPNFSQMCLICQNTVALRVLWKKFCKYSKGYETDRREIGQLDSKFLQLIN